MRPALPIGLTLLLAATPALAWGDYAHRLTARIALAGMTPGARAAAARILARGGRAVGTPECPLRTLEDASVWPDCIRQYKDRFAFSYPWHYHDIDICRSFDFAAGCPAGDCATAQIPRQLGIVADRRASPAARAQALAFAVHFIGDMHQPLHIGEHQDKGGNDIRAAYGAKAPERMNLHRIWDAELAERALTEPPALSPARITPAQRRAWSAGTVADWARESWQASRDHVYAPLAERNVGAPLAEGNACAVLPGRRVRIGGAYVQQAIPVVRQRVGQAGVRIAMLLNRALGR